MTGDQTVLDGDERSASGNTWRTHWDRLPFAARALLAGLSVLISLNFLARGLDRSVQGDAPGGNPASSFATRDTGLAAYAELLTRWEHPVERRRDTLDRGQLDPASTIFVLEPGVLTDGDTAALLEFVTLGGRLVIGGSFPDYLLTLRDMPPTWTTIGNDEYTNVDESLSGVGTVASAAAGSWTDSGTSRSLVSADGRSLLTAEAVGRGEILYLADVSALDNEHLALDDNAAFGVELAGATGRHVVFSEAAHGYSRRGLSALPTRWKIALAGITLAALLLMWARGRRLGPPEDAARPLPPARAEYVRALSVSLQRSGSPADALAPVTATVRARIAARAGLGPMADDEAMRSAATSLGLTDEEQAAVFGQATTDGDVLALGRALARVGTATARRETP